MDRSTDAILPPSNGAKEGQLTLDNLLPYHYPIEVNGGVYSIDMVRLGLRLPGNALDKLDARMGATQCDDIKSYSSRIRPGAFAILWTLQFGVSSATIGLGLIAPSGKPDIHKGFLEFNPNKIGDDPRFGMFLDRLASNKVGAELKRFDLAHDVMVPREWCSLVKDGRMYKCVVGHGITEYLGRKNVPGYVKVYDKSRESKIEEARITRVELTCGGEWSAGDVVNKWPAVNHWSSAAPGKPITRVVASLLAERSSRGESVEPYLHELHGETRRKLVRAMPSAGMEIDLETAAAMVKQARRWTHLQAW